MSQLGTPARYDKGVLNLRSIYAQVLSPLTLGLLLLPLPALAQTKNVQWYLGAITGLVNNSLIPFFFALAMLFLFVHLTRYFILDASDAYAREEAKRYMLFAILALVFLTGIWGIINLVTTSLGLDGYAQVCPDYFSNCN